MATRTDQNVGDVRAIGLIGGIYQPGHAALGEVPKLDVPDARARTLRLGPVRPTPARGQAGFAFTLPSAGAVTLELLDLQGRRVASALSGAWREAGPQSVSMRTAGVAPGVYFARLAWNGQACVTRCVVMR